MSFVDSIRYQIYRAKWHYGRHLNLASPVDVSLELSSLCNMRCAYCYHGDSERLPFKRGLMSFDLARAVLEQAAEIGVNSLKFNYRGESTINPEFKRITSYAKTLSGGSVFIDRVTNSNFKFNPDREDIFEGLCNQTKVKVSYDSFSKPVFESQRLGGDHELTTRNVEKFYRHPKRKKTRLVIQAVRTRANKNEDIEGSVLARWPEAEASIRDMVGGRTDRDISSVEWKKRDVSERRSCTQAHVRLIVLWDGRVSPCCPAIKEDLIMGDLRFQKLRDIFNGPAARALRRDLKSGRAFQVRFSCKNCSSFESYKNFKPVWDS